MAEPLDPAIAAYYGRGEEDVRTRGLARVEFVRTLELLERFLAPAPGRVLDVGGASGAYAFPLAARGYAVDLVDPVEMHVRQASERSAAAGVDGGRLSSARVGDARALAAEDASVDAVLLLGPLYHLTEREDRARALAEAARVVRPGGVVVAAAISRFAPTWEGLLFGRLLDEGFEAMAARDVVDGQHRNAEPDRHPEWFTTAYFHTAAELAAELREAGLGVEALVAVEGPAGLMADAGEWLDDPERRELLLRAVRRVEAEPSLLGASPHLLAVGRCRTSVRSDPR